VFGRLAEELALEVQLAFVAVPESDRLELTSTTGLHSRQLAAVQKQLFAPDSTSALPELRKEFIVEEIDQQPEKSQFEWLRSIGAKWCIGIPLRAGAQLLGARVMISLSRGRFDIAETQLIRTVCQLAAVSVDRAMLLEETRRAKDVAEA